MLIKSCEDNKIVINLTKIGQSQINNDKDVSKFIQQRFHLIYKALITNIGPNNFGVFKRIAQQLKNLL